MERRLTAILSADVKGYSRLMSEDEELTIRTLIAYRAVMASLIHRYRGRVVDAPGDNLLAEFASVVNAVQSALAIQRELRARNRDLPTSKKMEFRIGINLGDVVVEGENIYGDGVNIAARLESLAEPGGICLSEAVYDQIATKLAVGCEDLGVQEIKNMTKPVRVYRVQEKPEVPAPTVSAEQAPLLAWPDKPAVAVLPFANLSSDPAQEDFSDGLTEDLITDLSKHSGLLVSSRHAVFLYKGKTVKPEQVSQELGVQYVLEGSVRRADSRVRITAQLVDATTGYPLWAERYDRELHDMFAVQDEVTREIRAALEVKLAGGEQKCVERPPTNDLEAADYAVRRLEDRVEAAADTRVQTQQMVEKASEFESPFVAAQACLGGTHFAQWAGGWRVRTRRFWRRVLCWRNGLSSRMALCSHSL